MMRCTPTEEEMREARLNCKREEAYDAICPPMNRAERRTARGRMLVAQGEAAALRAEVEFLRQELEYK
jgi:hypothetical protein